MTICSVKGCHSTSGKQKKYDQITFHNFPVDSVIANRWIQKIRCNRKEDSWKPTKNTKICSMHFRDEDMYLTKKGMRRIRRGAVPAKRLFLSYSESDSDNMEKSLNPHEFKVETISTERYPASCPSTSTDEPDNVRILRANIPDENNAEVLIESTFNNKPVPDIYSSDSDSIFDTPRKHRLRRELRRKSVLQIKHTRIIKTLRQKILRLQKRNASLNRILLTLKKQRYIDNDVSNILSKNSFAADLYNNLCEKISKNKKRPMPKYTPEFRKFCLQKRNASLKQILLTLKKERYIDNDVSNILSKNSFAADLYNNLCKKISKNKKRPMPKYTPEFRKFCLTLNFYSPRAYNYVRAELNTCLPHPKTLSNWYRTVDGAPGFTSEAFDLLSLKTKNSNNKLICALVADEMAIRQQSIWDGNQNHGYVDMGAGISDNGVKASEVYVFLLVCLNEHFKIPLGYFLTHGLTGTQKANLINICLTKCEDAGVKVVSLTFDGHPTNLSCMELLGCKIKKPDQLKTTFKHPSAKHNVAVFLDPSHMLKLVRNHFENKKTLLNKDENEINWDYIVKLNDLQEKTELHIANKLTRKHLNFRNSIMNVKLAVQLLSRSVATALRFCREDLKLPDFQNSAATEEFIVMFNNIFDILNTRRLAQHGFKHPLSLENKDEVYTFLKQMKAYILNLNIKITRKRTYQESQRSIKLPIKSYKPVLETQANTGFLGILICIESLIHIFETIVIEKGEMNHITTYRVSQDHVELFFGTVRMHCGHNDNPNARQFKGIYRKFMCHMEIKAGETGNCIPLEDISILTCSSALKCINGTTSSHRFDDNNEEQSEAAITTMPTDELFLRCLLDVPENHVLTNHIVGYIAGFVVFQLKKVIKCMSCVDALTATTELWFHKLVILRDNGGLSYASKEVFSICCVSEAAVRNFVKEKKFIKDPREFKRLLLAIMKTFIGTPCFPTSDDHLNGHIHITNLISLIVEKYVKTRFFYISKRENTIREVESKRKVFMKQLQMQGF